MSTLTPNPDSPLASPTGYETAGGGGTGGNSTLGSPTFGGAGSTTPLPPPTPVQPAALSWPPPTDGRGGDDDSVEALGSPSAGVANPSQAGTGSGRVHRAGDAGLASQSRGAESAAARSSQVAPQPAAAAMASHKQVASAGNRRSIIASSVASPRPNTGRSDRSGGLQSRPAAEPQLSPLEKLPPLPPPLRIAVVGAAKSGKTQIINRYLTGCYSRAYVPTPKISLGLKALHTANLGHGYALEIWDVPASQALEESFVESGWIDQMDGAIIVSDAGDLRSFQAVRRWADVFTEHALLRLADNLAALGLDENASGNSGDSATAPALAAHSLRTGPEGKLTLVSAFPCILFANKADGGGSVASGSTQLSAQDIFDSAKHFKLAAGFLGSALCNRSVLPPGTQAPLHFLPGSHASAGSAAAAAASVAAAPPGSAAAALQALNLHPADGGIEQAFAFLAAEMLKYQHLLSITPALQAANALTARSGSGGAGAGAEAEPASSRDAHSSAGGGGADRFDGLSTQRAQVGSAMTHRGSLIAGDLTSRRLLSSATGPSVPLPASLASLRQRSVAAGAKSPGAAAGSSAFSFNRGASVATSQQPKANQLAVAAAAQAADDAAARAQALRDRMAAQDEEDDEEVDDSEDSDSDESSESEESDEEDDGEEGGN